MSNLEEAGFAAVYNLSGWTGNVNIYLRDVDRINKADSKSEKSSRQAGKAKRDYGKEVGKAGKQAGTAAGLFRRAGDSAERSGRGARSGAQGFSTLTNSLLGISSAIHIAQTGVRLFQNMNQGLQDMTARAAQIETVSNAFDGVAQSMGGADRVMAELRENTHGMVSDLELMRLANTALLNTSREYAEEVGPRFGTVIQAAYAGAAATGQNFEVVLDKVTRGIRLQQNLLVDDIGVRVNAEAANQAYAASIGVVASALTEEQQQAAWAADALRQMEVIIASSGGAGMNTLAVQVAQGSARIQNNLNQMAVNAAPSLAAFNAGFASIGAQVTGALAQLDPTPFFEGGANIIAALAQGLMFGARLVVEAVTIIAQTIANFLHGLSPPKKGPLSEIDVGGANIIAAWADGFNQVSLAPAEQLAGKVNDILSGVGGMGTGDKITVIEAMQERLEDRLRSSIAALSRGADNSAEVRALDAQRALIAQKLKLLNEQKRLEAVFGKEGAAALVGGGKAAGVAGGAGGGDVSGAATAAGALTDELKEGEKAAGGQAKKIGEVKNKLDKIDGVAKGGGGGAGGTGVPVLDTALGGGGIGGPGDYDPAAGFDPSQIGGSGITARLTETFAGITESWTTFVDDLKAAKARLDEMDLFGGLRSAIDTLQGIDTPEELVNFLLSLGGSLLLFPSHLISGLVTGFADLLGIELPDWMMRGLEVSVGILAFGYAVSLLPGIFASVGTAITAVKVATMGLLTGAFWPLAPVIGLVMLLFASMEERFGSVDEGVRRLGTAFRQTSNLIRTVFERAGNAVGGILDSIMEAFFNVLNDIQNAGQGLGIDLGIRVQGQLEAIHFRQTARVMSDRIEAELALVMRGERVSLSPELMVAIQSGQITLSSFSRGQIAQGIEQALQQDDAIALATLIQIADFTGAHVDPLARTHLQTLIDEDLAAGGDLQTRVDAIEITSVESVSLSDEARADILSEAESVLGEFFASTPVLANAVQVMLDNLSGGGVTRAGGGVGGGVGGGDGGTDRLISGREGAVPGNIMDIVTGRAGGATANILTPTLEEVTTWATNITATIETARAVLLDTFLIPTTEQFTAFEQVMLQNAMTITMYDLALMTTTLSSMLFYANTTLANTALAEGTGLTIAASAAYLGLGLSAIAAGTGIGGLSSEITGYIEIVNLGIERTHEFIQVINAIPRRISVILDVTINTPNLTSIGAGIAASMQNADTQAIGGGLPVMGFGGDVSAGRAYIVGDRGPEVYIPGADGLVVPNDHIIFAPSTQMPVNNITVSAPGGRGDTFNFYGPTDGDSVRRAASERHAFQGAY